MSWNIIEIALHVIGIVFAAFALIYTQTSQGAAAWALMLLFIPEVAVPLYLIFGFSKNKGYVLLRKEFLKKNEAQWKKLNHYLRSKRCSLEDENAIGALALEELAGHPFVCATDLKLLKNGDVFFPELIASLRKAEKSIDFQFYTFMDDEIGKELAAVLSERARSGVKVRILYDGLGSHKAKRRFFKELKENGVDVAAFATTRSRWRWLGLQINFRNHRKLVIIDDSIAFVGGMNVANEYLSRSKKYGFWRDTQIKFSGLPALAAKKSFVIDWYCSTTEEIDLRVDESTSMSNAKPQDESGAATVIVSTGPDGGEDSGSLSVLNAIGHAKDRLWIASPYFVPDFPMVSALQLAAMRGVDVKILTTRTTDHKTIKLASFTFMDELIPKGIEIYVYEKGLMHQKVMLVDDTLSYVGSMNFDNRSFRLNFEIGAWIADRSFSSEIEEMLKNDLKDCSKVGKSTIQNVPFWKQLAGGIVRLLAPTL